jgi:hypothetical protein
MEYSGMGSNYGRIAFSLCISLNFPALCSAQSTSLMAKFGIKPSAESPNPVEKSSPPLKSSALRAHLSPPSRVIQQPTAPPIPTVATATHNGITPPPIPEVVVSKQTPFPVADSGPAALSLFTTDPASESPEVYQEKSAKQLIPDVVVNKNLPSSLAWENSDVALPLNSTATAIRIAESLIPDSIASQSLELSSEGAKPIVDRPRVAEPALPTDQNRSTTAKTVAHQPPLETTPEPEIGIIGGMDSPPTKLSTASSDRTPQQNQDQIALVALKPVPTVPPMDAAVATPAANESQTRISETVKTYVLRAPDKKSEKGTAIPIRVLPFNKLVATQQKSIDLDRTYSTDTMVGPLTNVANLIPRLNVEQDLRNQPAAPVTNVRMDTDASGYGPEWQQNSYAWVAPTFHHKPLYFEQPNLERYGYGPRRAFQPLASGAHFFTSVGLFPYKVLTQHPYEKVYTLGNNRPGDCVPYQKRTLLGQSYLGEACMIFDDHSGYR